MGSRGAPAPLQGGGTQKELVNPQPVGVLSFHPTFPQPLCQG